MAKVGDLLSQIRKKKESATLASVHKHPTPDQLVKQEIKRHDQIQNLELDKSNVSDDANSVTNPIMDDISAKINLEVPIKTASLNLEVEAELVTSTCEPMILETFDNKQKSLPLKVSDDTTLELHTLVTTRESDYPNQSIPSTESPKKQNTTRHNKTQLDTTEHNSNKTQLNTTGHKSDDLEISKVSIFNDLPDINLTQLNTISTAHNRTQLDTTVHTYIGSDSITSDSSEHNRTQLNTTEQNQTPQGTQRNTTTEHNQTQELNTTEHKISSLSGVKSQVLSFLCQRSLEVGKPVLTMSYDMLADFSDVKKGSIKTTCIRLKSLNLIAIHSSGGGRNQMTGFEVFPETSNAYSRIKTLNKVNIFNITTTHNQTQELNTPTGLNYTQPHTILNTTPPSKLVSNYNNNLLTREAVEEIKLDVSAINLDKVVNYKITRKQVQDIYNQKLEFTTSTLQDFVDRFGIYISDPKNIRGVNSVPAIFVKMAQLASKGQDPLIDIETDADRLIRERIERLKAIREERLKQEQELMALEFENWVLTLSPDQVNKLVPPTAALKPGSSMQKILLKNYFADTIWPGLHKKVLTTPGLFSEDTHNHNQI